MRDLEIGRFWAGFKQVSIAASVALAFGVTSLPANAGSHEAGEAHAAALSETSATLLKQVIAGDHRSDKDKARDAARHPFETLSFFGVEANMTVIEVWPGGGWYTEILAPYVSQGGGTFYAAHWDPEGASDFVTKGLQRFQERFADKETYGSFVLSALGANSEEIAPAGSADVVVTFRNLHNWVPRGNAEKFLRDIYKALKPGGTFGMIDHRAKTDEPQDPKASSGYVREDYAIELAQKAGFVLVGSSEINANAKDTADHPFGVWTLPPTSARARFGQKPDENFDSSPFQAIGESDRFTLKFMKPHETE